MLFQSGQFFGHRDARYTLPGIAIADMRPTVPKQELCKHTHEEAHLIVLQSGAYASTARGMPEVCTQPVVIVNPPGTRHRDCFESLDGARFLTISVDAAVWADAAKAVDLPAHAMTLSPRALPAAYRLWNELLHVDDASALVVHAELQALLLQATEHAPTSQPAAWLQRARQRLQDDAGTVPGIAQLAHEADLHPVYFARAFRQAYGCSPGTFLRRCRIESAIAGLVGGKQALAEVALQSGYVDQSHMSNALRRSVGLSPLALRRLSRLQVANLQERRRRGWQAVDSNQELCT